MRLLILTAIIGLAFACQTTPKGSEKSVEEIKQEGAISNSDIVRNPVSASKPEDTVNVAKMTFEEDTYDFGQVKAGEAAAAREQGQRKQRGGGDAEHGILHGIWGRA